MRKEGRPRASRARGSHWRRGFTIRRLRKRSSRMFETTRREVVDYLVRGAGGARLRPKVPVHVIPRLLASGLDGLAMHDFSIPRRAGTRTRSDALETIALSLFEFRASWSASRRRRARPNVASDCPIALLRDWGNYPLERGHHFVSRARRSAACRIFDDGPGAARASRAGRAGRAPAGAAPAPGAPPAEGAPTGAKNDEKKGYKTDDKKGANREGEPGAEGEAPPAPPPCRTSRRRYPPRRLLRRRRPRRSLGGPAASSQRLQPAPPSARHGADGARSRVLRPGTRWRREKKKTSSRLAECTLGIELNGGASTRIVGFPAIGLKRQESTDSTFGLGVWYATAADALVRRSLTSGSSTWASARRRRRSWATSAVGARYVDTLWAGARPTRCATTHVGSFSPISSAPGCSTTAIRGPANRLSRNDPRSALQLQRIRRSRLRRSAAASASTST